MLTKNRSWGGFAFIDYQSPSSNPPFYNIAVSFGSERVNFVIKLSTYVATMYILQQSDRTLAETSESYLTRPCCESCAPH